MNVQTHRLCEMIETLVGVTIRWFVSVLMGVGLGVSMALAAPAADDVEMILIPAGPFTMGANHLETDSDERPPHQLHLAAFRIDKYEVTHARYRRCVEAGVCTLIPDPAYDDPGRADYPVALASWPQAVAYCQWAGKRLPTEAEWEKAARGTDGRRYPWGNQIETGRANVHTAHGVSAVGAFPRGASPYGVMDMAGNVWEWTSSRYQPYPYDVTDGREGLQARGARVNRGGSWVFDFKYAQTTHRSNIGHIYRRHRDLGFRCAASVEP